MPDTQSIVIIKEFVYRGAPEEWSNRYHFEGTPITTDAQWLNLATDIYAEEAQCLASGVKFVRAYGYDAGVEHSIWQHDWTVPGPAPTGAFVPAADSKLLPGDTAATIRWDTSTLNTRGKKIYCRKYFHSVFSASGNSDTLDPTQAAKFNLYAQAMISGGLENGSRYCAPQGADLSNPYVDTFLTTRTLKRRGKRPLPSGTPTRGATSGTPGSTSLGSP